MIRINLLPEELQRAASVARTFIMSLAVGVLVVAVAGVALGFMVVWHHQYKREVSELEFEVSKVKEKAAEVDRINEDIAFYKDREKAIIEIKSRRILWSQKMAQVAELTPADIWIIRVQMKTLDPTEYKWEKDAEQTGGRLGLTCYAQGTEASAILNFRKSLSGDKAFYKDLIDVRALPDNFFGDFSGSLPPGWSVVTLDGYAQRSNLKFDLEMDLKPLVERPANLDKKDDKDAKKKNKDKEKKDK